MTKQNACLAALSAEPTLCFETNDADALPIPIAVRERLRVTYPRHLFASAEVCYTVPEGIMQKSKAEKLRKLASKRQIVRAKDARELGIPRTYLPRLARRGNWKRSVAVSIPLGISPEPRTLPSSRPLTKSLKESFACSPHSDFTISLRSLPTRFGWRSVTKPGLPNFPLPPFESCACPGLPFTLE